MHLKEKYQIMTFIPKQLHYKGLEVDEFPTCVGDKKSVLVAECL